MKFKLAQAVYDEAQVSEVVELEAMRRAIVAEGLRNFDNQQKEIKDLKVWLWSPLYRIFRLWHVRNVVEGPWEHSDHEWSIFHSILIKHAKYEPSSLENDCPHIISVFKFIFQNVHSRSRPLIHPEKVSTTEYIKSVTNDKQHFTMITNAAIFLENMK